MRRSEWPIGTRLTSCKPRGAEISEHTPSERPVDSPPPQQESHVPCRFGDPFKLAGEAARAEYERKNATINLMRNSDDDDDGDILTPPPSGMEVLESNIRSYIHKHMLYTSASFMTTFYHTEVATGPLIADEQALIADSNDEPPPLHESYESE